MYHSFDQQIEPDDKLANAIRRNVALTIKKLKSASDILGKAVADNKLRIAGGVYKLKSGRIELLT
jgi:carbonic anhydrase